MDYDVYAKLVLNSWLTPAVLRFLMFFEVIYRQDMIWVVGCCHLYFNPFEGGEDIRAVCLALYLTDS